MQERPVESKAPESMVNDTSSDREGSRMFGHTGASGMAGKTDIRRSEPCRLIFRVLYIFTWWTRFRFRGLRWVSSDTQRPTMDLSSGFLVFAFRIPLLVVESSLCKTNGFLRLSSSRTLLYNLSRSPSMRAKHQYSFNFAPISLYFFSLSTNPYIHYDSTEKKSVRFQNPFVSILSRSSCRSHILPTNSLREKPGIRMCFSQQPSCEQIMFRYSLSTLCAARI